MRLILTHLVISIDGNKTNKAANWSMPIVNHTWLEDCFIHWKYISPAHEKYISFPPGMNFAQLLGDRGLSSAVLKESLKEVEAQMEEETREIQAGVDVEMNNVGGEDEGGQNAVDMLDAGVLEEEQQQAQEVVLMQEEEIAPVPQDAEEEDRSAPSTKARDKNAQHHEDIIEVSHELLFLFTSGTNEECVV